MVKRNDKSEEEENDERDVASTKTLAMARTTYFEKNVSVNLSRILETRSFPSPILLVV